MLQDFSLKKNKVKNCLDSLIYYTTDVYPTQPAYGELFSTNPPTQFFLLHSLIFICVHPFHLSDLFLFMIICKNLFLFVIICQNHFLFMITCDNLFLFMIICENLFKILLSVKISFYLWSSVRIFLHIFCFLKSLWK